MPCDRGNSCLRHRWQLSRRVAKGIRAATHGAGCPPRQLLRLVGRWGDICAHATHRASEASDTPVPPARRNSTKNIPAPPLALTRCANMRPKSAVAKPKTIYLPLQASAMLSAGAMLLSNAAGYSPSSSPSQLVILGMHHSGTSLLANLTMMMGAHGGEKDELLLHPDNPLKYWERRDVVALDEARLAAGLNEAISQRYDMPSWVAYGFDAEKAAAPVHGSAEAKAIVSKLNEKRPWVTKDPRMSLVASEWMQLLDAPACIIMHREPLSVANSMMIYSHNVSLAEWISVYENYYASTMRACKGVRAPPAGTGSRMGSPPGKGGGGWEAFGPWRAGQEWSAEVRLCEPQAPRPTPPPRLTRSLQRRCRPWWFSTRSSPRRPTRRCRSCMPSSRSLACRACRCRPRAASRPS